MLAFSWHVTSIPTDLCRISWLHALKAQMSSTSFCEEQGRGFAQVCTESQLSPSAAPSSKVYSNIQTWTGQQDGKKN